MNRSLIIFCLLAIPALSSAQTEWNTFSDKGIGWTFEYPEVYNKVSEEEIAQISGIGQDMMGDIVDLDTIEIKNLIWLRKDAANLLTSSHEAFQHNEGYTVLEEIQYKNDIILDVMKENQMNIEHKMDHTYLDGLRFERMTVKIFHPSDKERVILTQVILDRIINDSRLLTINYNFNNPMDEELFQRVLKTSKFSIRD